MVFSRRRLLKSGAYFDVSWKLRGGYKRSPRHQDFPNNVKGREYEIFLGRWGGTFLAGGGNVRRSDSDHSNLFQS